MFNDNDFGRKSNFDGSSRSSGVGQIQGNQGRSSFIKGPKANNPENMGEIDFDRASEYTIYNIAELMHQSKCNFTRNSNFPFKLKNGVKKYDEKSAELKVETYKTQD